MSFDEKSTWIFAVVSVVVAGIYAAAVLGQLPATAVTEIAYEAPMLATIGLGIALSVVGHIVAAISSPREADKRDERDASINRFGEYIGSFVLYGGALLALGFALAKAEHFWIANAIYATFIVSALTTSAVKLVAYRRGF